MGGSRALHARRRVANDRIQQNCLVGVSDEREVFWQQPGETYLSVPCCFPHAVEYPQCDWDNRIVAVQVRLFLNEEELFGMMGKEHTALDIDPRGHCCYCLSTACRRSSMASRCLRLRMFRVSWQSIASMAM